MKERTNYLALVNQLASSKTGETGHVEEDDFETCTLGSRSFQNLLGMFWIFPNPSENLGGTLIATSFFMLSPIQ